MEIREQLRRDHAKALAELDAIASEPDGRRAQARLARLRHAWMDLVTRHIETEEGELFVQLAERFPAEELSGIGRRFMLARDKLALLEAVKKAA